VPTSKKSLCRMPNIKVQSKRVESGIRLERFGLTRRMCCMRCMLCRCKNDRRPQLFAATAKSPCCTCCVTFLHIHFSSTPTLILNLTISSESQSATEFYDIFCVGKYCQLFTHESIIDQYVSVSACRHCKVLDENTEKCQKPRQKQPLPLEARGLPSNA